MMEIATGLLSGIIGVITGVAFARKAWVRTDVERNEAERTEADRLIEQIERRYELALANAELEYTNKLEEAKLRIREEVREEVERQFLRWFDAYGCDLAPDCGDHKPHTRPALVRGF